MISVEPFLQEKDVYLFFFFFLPFLGLLSQHMEVPKVGVESEP